MANIFKDKEFAMKAVVKLLVVAVAMTTLVFAVPLSANAKGHHGVQIATKSKCSAKNGDTCTCKGACWAGVESGCGCTPFEF
jgi:hypothetical protein